MTGCMSQVCRATIGIVGWICSRAIGGFGGFGGFVNRFVAVGTSSETASKVSSGAGSGAGAGAGSTAPSQTAKPAMTKAEKLAAARAKFLARKAARQQA